MIERKIKLTQLRQHATGVIADLPLKEIDAEIHVAAQLRPYEAVSELWVCLVKLANLFPIAGEEHEQVCSLVRRFERKVASQLLQSKALDCLLALDPPLETVLAHPRERLDAKTDRELRCVKSRRKTDPKGALLAVIEILQRIRDKKMHGFKTPQGPRDQVILESAASLLRDLCGKAAQHVARAEQEKVKHA
ncbi:MAG: hypothetical protein AABM64_13235 [Pseudomonadota bacterium]